MSHPGEEKIAGYIAGVVSNEDSALIGTHLAACDQCRDLAAAYREIVTGLRQPRLSPAALEGAWETLSQRLRLRQFVDRLLADPAWQEEVQRDPRAALEHYQIRPTPQLVAALKELEDRPGEMYGKDLDERISKFILNAL